MGNSTSRRKQPPVIATCSSPMYCVKKLGARHILIGGGGGASKTGVANQIEEHLITFQNSSNNYHMKTKLVKTIDTEQYATMNMDVICRCSTPEGTKYLLAAGHDQYCDVYESTNYFTEKSESTLPCGSLGINFHPVGRLQTDLSSSENPYQKCVRFDKSTRGKRMLTGGSDGHIRVWDIDNLLNNRNPEHKKMPIHELNAHPGGEVEDIDVSPDGRFFFSTGKDNKVILWDLTVGKRVQALSYPPEIEKGYKVRSLRFTNLGGGGNNFIFVVAYNSIQRNSKCRSYLGLWALHREKHTLQNIILKQCNYQGESISCITVSPCGNYTGIGTLAGSVAVFDTHEMKPLLFVKETHGIFVTDIVFLDRVADDIFINNPEKKRRIEIPGPGADCRACLVSLSADQTIQVHKLPFEPSPSTTLFLLNLMIFLNLVYFLVWTLAGL